MTRSLWINLVSGEPSADWRWDPSETPPLFRKIEYNEDKDPKEIVVDEFIGQSIPIYLYEIAHGTTKGPQESILFYFSEGNALKRSKTRFKGVSPTGDNFWKKS